MRKPAFAAVQRVAAVTSGWSPLPDLQVDVAKQHVDAPLRMYALSAPNGEVKLAVWMVSASNAEGTVSLRLRASIAHPEANDLLTGKHVVLQSSASGDGTILADVPISDRVLVISWPANRYLPATASKRVNNR